MRILITGGTGFIGRPLIAALQREGHAITLLVRDKCVARSRAGPEVELVEYSISDVDLVALLDRSDAVINLAGEPISGVRWTESKKQLIEKSRIGITSRLASGLDKCESRPQVFISASAVGYYGERFASELDEDCSAGEGYLADLCQNWEREANRCSQNGVRVCILRLGIVLGREGGILQALEPSFQAGIGSYFGSGRQYISWVHIVDVVRTIEFCLKSVDIEGIINCVAPEPVRARDFCRSIKLVTGSKLELSVPAFLLRLIFGDGYTLLINSQRVIPRRLTELGYQFRYTDLSSALMDEFQNADVTIDAKTRLQSPSLSGLSSPEAPRGLSYQLRSGIELRREVSSLFEFFSSPHNLGMLTPSWMEFELVSIPESMGPGVICCYNIRLWGVPFKWTSRIRDWEEGKHFIDFQLNGPYRAWWHYHQFIPLKSGETSVQDVVTYSLPLWLFGRVIHRLFVKRYLLQIFQFRRRILMFRFGSSAVM